MRLAGVVGLLFMGAAWLILVHGAWLRAEDNAPSRLVTLQDGADRFERELESAEASVAHLSSEWAEVRDGFHAARTKFEQARDLARKAGHVAQGAGTLSLEAAADDRDAIARFRLYEQLVLVAAAVDAANIAGGRGGKGIDCSPVSTSVYRSQLAARGVDLMGKDIDHIVPRALGGAEHPSNYQVLPSSENRALGSRWDLSKCIAAGSKCAEAIAVSRLCGTYRGGIPE